MSSPRVRKIADRIQVTVAEMLERRVKDPRLGFVTVTDVRVSGDTQHASVFYTVFGEEEQVAASAAALESAKGLIRSNPYYRGRWQLSMYGSAGRESRA